MNSPYPTEKKIMKKGKEISKTEWVRNSDKKKKFMDSFGMKTEADFVSRIGGDKNWSKFVEPSFPPRFAWLWLTFLDIWRTCQRDFNGNVVLTPRVLTDYCECFLVSLTVQEKHLIFKIKSWAEDEAYALKEKAKEA